MTEWIITAVAPNGEDAYNQLEWEHEVYRGFNNE